MYVLLTYNSLAWTILLSTLSDFGIIGFIVSHQCKYKEMLLTYLSQDHQTARPLSLPSHVPIIEL